MEQIGSGGDEITLESGENTNREGDQRSNETHNPWGTPLKRLRSQKHRHAGVVAQQPRAWVREDHCQNRGYYHAMGEEGAGSGGKEQLRHRGEKELDQEVPRRPSNETAIQFSRGLPKKGPARP